MAAVDLGAEATALSTALAAAIGRSDPAEISGLLEQLGSFAKLLPKEQADRIPAAINNDLVTMAWAVIAAFEGKADPSGLVPLAGSVFEALLNRMPAAAVLPQPQLAEALGHSSEHVRAIALGQVARDPQLLLGLPVLLAAVVGRVGDDEVATGLGACRQLAELASTEQGLEAVLAPDTTAALQAMASKSETVLVRVLSELYITIVQSAPSAVAAIVAAGAFGPLVSLVASDDVLAKMAVIEALATLATAPGYTVLETLGIPDRLWATLSTGADKMEAQLLGPVVMQLFARLVVVPGAGASVAAKYPLLDIIADNIGDASRPLQAPCLEAVKIIAEAPAGSDRLLAAAAAHASGGSGGRGSILHQLGRIAMESNRGAQQAAAFHVIAAVLSPSQDEGAGGSEGDPKQRLFDLVIAAAAPSGGAVAFLGFVLGRAKLPFPETSTAAFALLQAVADQPWGRPSLLQVPAFYEELTNRSVGSREQREWKFAIAQRFVRYPDGLGGTQLVDLRKFVSQGPHYRPPVIGGAVMSEFAG